MDGSHACFNFARSMVVRGVGGQGGQLPIQVLEDQLSLSELERADCAPSITTCPLSFRQLPTPLEVLRKVK